MLYFKNNNVDNAELYSKVGVPFVMGTTGGDRNKLYETVEKAKIYAVISPQMGKQVMCTRMLRSLRSFLAYIYLLCWFTRLLRFLRPWRSWLSSFQEHFLVTPWRLLSYFC